MSRRGYGANTLPGCKLGSVIGEGRYEACVYGNGRGDGPFYSLARVDGIINVGVPSTHAKLRMPQGENVWPNHVL